jgi:hypothetical protein
MGPLLAHRVRTLMLGLRSGFALLLPGFAGAFRRSEPDVADQRRGMRRARMKGESDIAQGVCSYDAAAKRYALTLKGETTKYTLLSRGDPVTCILYKGDLDSADLRASWFSYPTSEESPD